MKTTQSRGWIVTAILVTAGAWTLSGQGLPVTYERIMKADQEPGNWLTYSGSYSGWRFSKLNQITAQNVKNLRVKETDRIAGREKDNARFNSLGAKSFDD